LISVPDWITLAAISNAFCYPHQVSLASYCRIMPPKRRATPLKTFDPTGSVIGFTAKPFFVCWCIDLRV
jgi:hypothetical protein